MTSQPSRPRLISPKAKQKTAGEPSRKLRLFQVGHVPHSLCMHDEGVIGFCVERSFFDPVIIPPEFHDLFNHRCGTRDQPEPIPGVVAHGIVFGGLISPERCVAPLQY